MSIPKIIESVQYERKGGKRPFDEWLKSLNVQARVRVEVAISRLEEGNFSNVNSLKEGVSECKVHFGPGYRIYFGMDGEKLVILLGGGTKKRQRRDIEVVKRLWKEYKSRKKEGEIQWH